MLKNRIKLTSSKIFCNEATYNVKKGVKIGIFHTKIAPYASDI